MAKFFKVGTVQLKKDKTGQTIRLGNPVSKDKRYVSNVELTVRDADNKVLASSKNGYLSVLDPRKKKNKDGTELSEDQLSKIPDYILRELVLVVDET